MWQMGGVGPMLGQVHHFVKYNKGKAPYAEERYLKEAHRLYGVLDRQLAKPRIRRRRLLHRRHLDLALDLALRVADHRSRPVSERAALVQGDCGPAGRAEGLRRAGEAARHPDALSGPRRPKLPFESNDQQNNALEMQGTAMTANPNFSGVIAPVLTPFGEDGAPDLDRFVEHCEWLMEDGCTALAPFGTTSEGNSIGLDERMEMLEELVDAGIDPKKLMPGTGTCSVADAIILTEHAVDLGCGGVLMLPPFYYKNPSEEGLFRFFAEVIEEVARRRAARSISITSRRWPRSASRCR